jgi:hypothetical protein
MADCKGTNNYQNTFQALFSRTVKGIFVIFLCIVILLLRLASKRATRQRPGGENCVVRLLVTIKITFEDENKT